MCELGTDQDPEHPIQTSTHACFLKTKSKFPVQCALWLVLTLKEVVQLLDVLVVVCRVAAVEQDFRCVRANHQTYNKNPSIINNQLLKTETNDVLYMMGVLATTASSSLHLITVTDHTCPADVLL